MLNKTIIIILSIISSNHLIANPLTGLGPLACLPDQDCTCFTKPVIGILAQGLREAEICKIENQELREFIKRKHDAKQELPWYQEPSVIVGGTVISFSLGALLVWTASQ